VPGDEHHPPAVVTEETTTRVESDKVIAVRGHPDVALVRLAEPLIEDQEASEREIPPPIIDTDAADRHHVDEHDVHGEHEAHHGEADRVLLGASVVREADDPDVDEAAADERERRVAIAFDSSISDYLDHDARHERLGHVHGVHGDGPYVMLKSLRAERLVREHGYDAFESDAAHHGAFVEPCDECPASARCWRPASEQPAAASVFTRLKRTVKKTTADVSRPVTLEFALIEAIFVTSQAKNATDVARTRLTDAQLSKVQRTLQWMYSRRESKALRGVDAPAILFGIVPLDARNDAISKGLAAFRQLEARKFDMSKLSLENKKALLTLAREAGTLANVVRSARSQVKVLEEVDKRKEKETVKDMRQQALDETVSSAHRATGGTPEAVRVLRDLAQSSDPRARSIARQTLERYGELA
jgi:hypothetical protein